MNKWLGPCIEAVKNAMDGLTDINNQILERSANIKTKADLEADGKIVPVLEATGMPCEIISEESEKPIVVGDGGNTQIHIDPVDGTFMFFKGNTKFCSSTVLVVEDNKPTVAVVGDIGTGDIFHCDEKHAYLNNEKLAMDREKREIRLIAGYASWGERLEKGVPGVLPLTSKDVLFINNGGHLEACKILQGNYDALIEFEPIPLYEFAGITIASRGGGVASTLEGKELVYEKGAMQTALVSADREFHDKILACFK